MPVSVNLRHLEDHSVTLKGSIPLAELDIETLDPTIKLREPLEYDLEAEKLEDGLLVQGCASLTLDCQCVRCLKEFKHTVKLENWYLHLPFEGEDAAPVVNDVVDLTPYVREDILLEFPQHPLCEVECSGLPKPPETEPEEQRPGQAEHGSSAWAALNKLKL